MENIDSFKEEGRVPLEFELNGKIYTGQALPVKSNSSDESYNELDVTLNGTHTGILYKGSNNRYTLPGVADEELVRKIIDIVEVRYSS